MYMKCILFVLCMICSSVKANEEDTDVESSPSSYNGYSVFRIIPSSEKELEFVRSLRNDLQLDFWIEPGMVNRQVDVMIPPWRIEKITTDLKNLNITFSVLIENVQSLVDKEHEELRRAETSFRRKRALDPFFVTYHRASEISEFLYLLKKNFPSLMTIENIGITFERRQLKLVKISTNPKASKPIIWIDGGIHAREWIAPTTAAYFIHKILKESRRKTVTSRLLEIYDFYIMPLVNPDGYDFTHSAKNRRLWRKNRSRSDRHSEGVDLNRNFKYGWNNSLTTLRELNPHSESYQGPFAMSEKESQAIESTLLRIKERVKLFLSLHSFGQLILFPWGCKMEDVENYKELKAIGDRAAKEIKLLYGTEYKTESTIKQLYAATGTSIDWAYGELGIKYSYVIELRDKGKQNFVLNPREIIPVGEETWRGVQSIIVDITTEDKSFI